MTLSIEQMRTDIADVLQENVSAVVAGENLVDIGLDSIRIMMLASRWSMPGAPIEFADLAEYPELMQWWETVCERRAAAERLRAAT
jgi:bifunctional isochorismate lyase/aryl carrier protein